MRNTERFYRDFTNTRRWTSFRVCVATTDLYIRARSDFSENVRKTVIQLRGEIEDHIALYPDFLSSYTPLEQKETDSLVVQRMYRASAATGVGPMAAVAGALSEYVGREIAPLSDEVIIENGGDIWLNLQEPVSVSVYAGNSPFTDSLAIRIMPSQTPLSICTSSGRIGHSFSFGEADAATVFSPDAALADAAATATGNLVHSAEDLTRAVEFAMSIDGVTGAMVLYGDKLAVMGAVELIPRLKDCEEHEIRVENSSADAVCPEHSEIP
jgi:ApbE superfamily uncharacterized protein (UPF0280 family)